MGSENSTYVRQADLENAFIGTVSEENGAEGDLLNMYYRRDNDILLISTGEADSEKTDDDAILCREAFKVSHLVGVKADETDTFVFFYPEISDIKENECSMRVSIMAYDSNKDTFKFKYFIFHDKYEFRNAQTILTNFNKLCFESSKRLLCVFVNPVSGSGLSRDYYNKILLPVLEFTGINHEMFETSPKFFDTFFENLNIDEQKYTDFVVVGGDGLFGQLLNSVMAHKDKSKLMKLSFGFMPGGSCNALSCALGSKNPYLAAIQIARGITVKSDMFRIDMTDKGPTECSLNPFKKGTELAYLFIVFFANTHINSNL